MSSQLGSDRAETWGALYDFRIRATACPRFAWLPCESPGRNRSSPQATDHDRLTCQQRMIICGCGAFSMSTGVAFVDAWSVLVDRSPLCRFCWKRLTLHRTCVKKQSLEASRRHISLNGFDMHMLARCTVVLPAGPGVYFS